MMRASTSSARSLAKTLVRMALYRTRQWRFGRKINDGIGNELTNDDLSRMEDEAESAISAQDGGRDADEYLEPIIDEAE